MPRTLNAVAVATLAIAGNLSSAPAQATTQAPSVDSDSGAGFAVHGPSVYGAWIAGARHSPFHTRTGAAGYRNFYLTSVRFAWSLGDAQSRAVSGSYFIDVVPAAMSTDMPEYHWNSRCRPDSLCPGATPIPHSVYAFGLTPIGWAVAFGSGPARLTMEASGGGLWFTRRIPDPAATRFNFTASAGPTLELRVTQSQTFRVGYLWHHTSNGGTGKVNPGLNSGILAAGLLWRSAASHR